MKSRLIIAVVGVVATFLLAACRGGPSQSAAFVPAEQTVTADTVPHIFHITPFRKAKKPISKSSGQDVYTLWGWSGVKVGRTAGTVTTFGAPATDGNAGPMAQVAIMTSSTEKQHVYVDSLNTLRELTDAATGIVMLAKTVSSSKTEISVCENGKLVGIITITNGKVGTQKKAEPTCPKSLDVLVPATDQPANSDATSSYPTEKNVDYDLCELSMDGGAIPTAATLFTAAKTFDKSLTPLGPAYKAFATTLKSACHSGVSLSPPKQSPCSSSGKGAGCTYSPPPVVITTLKATCPSAVVTVYIKFYSPGQNCTINVPYNVGTSGSFTITNPNPSAVTVTPASQSLSGSGNVNVTLVAGSAGGPDDITATVLAASSTQNVEYFAVTNEWSTSATPEPLETSYPIAGYMPNPQGITVGPDNALWFAENGLGSIGRITTDGSITSYLVSANSEPHWIVAGSDGALWFTADGSNALGRMPTTGTSPTAYTISANAVPQEVAAGPDGALWVTDSVNNQIDRVTTAGAVTQYNVPTAGSVPTGIAVGSDGALWFTENSANQIGRITTTGSITEYTLSNSQTNPAGIASGPDGNLWLTDQSSQDVIYQVTTAGVSTAFSANYFLGSSITMGPDGALWFTGGTTTNPIGRITTTGDINWASVYLVSPCPNVIVTGPDKGLWYTDPCNQAIGRLSPTAITTGIRRRR